MARKKRTREERYADLMARLPNFTLMDDTFMSAFFNEQNECTELVLRIILKKDDLRVTESKTQFVISSLKGRSARLDIKAVDSKGVHYDIEIQNANDGADVKRTRFNHSMMDSNFLKKSDEYTDLPETYVIFITENDVLEGNEPIYHIEKTILETNKLFDDKQHTIYVNSSYKSEDELGKLMQDFKNSNFATMNYKTLSERAEYLKQNRGNGMSEFLATFIEEEIEDRLEERENAMRKEIVINLLNSTTLSKSEIALNAKVTLKEVEEIAKEIQR